MEFTIKPFYGNRYGNGCSGFRNRGLFLIGGERISLDARAGRIGYVTEGGDISRLLATCSLKVSRKHGLTGEVVVDGGEVLHVSANGQYTNCIQVSSGKSEARLKVSVRRDFLIQYEGIELRADLSRPGSTEFEAVQVSCADGKEVLGTVLGILVHALLFDHLIDPGSHI